MRSNLTRHRFLVFFLFALLALVAGFRPCGAHADDLYYDPSNKRDLAEILTELEQVQREVKERNYSFTVGYNPASEYRIEQLCGLVAPSYVQEESASVQAEVEAATFLPSAYDWRDYDGVSAIKNQGSCGSCWAFATVAVLEGQIKIQCGLEVDLSEQFLVSCNEDGYGCGGGWWAHDYHQDPGAVLESAFPYQGTDAACGGPYSYPYQIDYWNYVGVVGGVPSVGAIKQAIYDYGAVAVGICVGTQFQNYTGGIFEADESSYCRNINHGVTLVGWNDDLGTDNGYWILKNSWSTGWGEDGYMRIRYGKSRVGYGASYVAFSDCGASTGTGSLKVTISPADAVSAGAQWQVDGGTWMSSGATVTGLTVGSHTVAFKSIGGWTTPANQTVTVQAGQTTTASGTYSQETGSLKVTILPADAVSAGAQWQVDGGTWMSSGATVTGLTVGSHTVAFKSIGGWTTPASQTVTILSGLTNSATGTYVQQTGSLTVTISPSAAVSAGAQWQVDGGTWRNSGATVTGLTVGSHTVSFKDVTGWTTPAGQTVTVSYNTTTSTAGVYVVPSGSLTVTLSPDVVAQIGGQWRVDGGAWQSSGAVVADLTVGDHVVEFKDVAGWSKPANVTATIVNGQTASASGTYSVQSGSASLTVTITPPAAVFAAAAESVDGQWRVDGGAWHSTGESVTGLSSGLHLLEFAPIPRWRTPASQVLEITAQTNTATGVYFSVKPMPWLTLLLED